LRFIYSIKQKGTEGITIVPDTSQNLYLHFQPVDLASCSFYLPIVINELLGPVSMLNSKSTRPAEILKLHEVHYTHLSGFSMTTLPDKLPTVSIDYTVADRIIFFSKLLFRFNTLTNEVRFYIDEIKKIQKIETQIVVYKKIHKEMY